MDIEPTLALLKLLIIAFRPYGSGIFNDFGPLVSWMSGFQLSLIQKQTHSSRK